MVHKRTAHPYHTKYGNRGRSLQMKTNLLLLPAPALVFAKSIISPAAANIIIMIMEGNLQLACCIYCKAWIETFFLRKTLEAEQGRILPKQQTSTASPKIITDLIAPGLSGEVVVLIFSLVQIFCE